MDRHRSLGDGGRDRDVAVVAVSGRIVGCRRAAGAPAVPWGTFARSAFSLSRGRIAEYRSSPQVARGFCPECGTSLTYRHERRAAEIDVTLASLDDPGALVPQMHLWVSDKLPWMSIGDGLPQFERGVPS